MPDARDSGTTREDDSVMGNIERDARRWHINSMGLGHSTHNEIHGPLVGPDERVEVVPASQLQGTVELLRETYDRGVGAVDRTNPEQERDRKRLSYTLDRINLYLGGQ